MLEQPNQPHNLQPEEIFMNSANQSQAPYPMSGVDLAKTDALFNAQDKTQTKKFILILHKKLMNGCSPTKIGF
jgi:hypothetical protein